MTTQLSTVDFYGQQLITFQHDGQPWVAMKPVVEGIGMDWKSQHAKLKDQADKFNCGDITMVAADGKAREMSSIPLRKLNGWLFSINPNKVAAALRDRVARYQEECFEALHDYWTQGVAIRNDVQPAGVEQTLRLLMSQLMEDRSSLVVKTDQLLALAAAARKAVDMLQAQADEMEQELFLILDEIQQDTGLNITTSKESYDA